MEATFSKIIEVAAIEEKSAQKTVNQLAIVRLAIFVLGAYSTWYYFKTEEGVWGILALVCLIGFLFFLKKQEAYRFKRDHYKNLQLINADEIGRLNYQYANADTGERYMERDHPNAGDLDLFGKHSLYRLLNRTTTSEGADRLAIWLKTNVGLETILGRQEAVNASKDNLEWRQRWQATAMNHKHAAQNIGVLKRWTNQSLPADLQALLKFRWLSIVTVATIVLWVAGVVSGWIPVIALMIQSILLKKFQQQIQEITSETYYLGQTILAYSDLLELSESAPFKGNWWAGQMKGNSNGGVILRNLGVAFSRLDFRNNVYFNFLIGFPIMWDLHCLQTIENWRINHKEQLNDWLDSVANIEAINSLAGLAFANPDWIQPTVSWDNQLYVSTTDMGHPMLHATKRVTNSFGLKGTGETVLITGSNMSGKSTFLRTLGINLVLAQIGAVVVAKTFECSLMQVFSSMRTQDSLEESTSSFFAELKRLKQLIFLAENTSSDLPIFYLLDEILKGTNSADRHLGAATLIRQLHDLKSSGLVSTHDLELGGWAEKYAYIRNLHFTSDIIEGQISFDYRLKEGICKSFNASELMKLMGIKIDVYGEKL